MIFPKLLALQKKFKKLKKSFKPVVFPKLLSIERKTSMNNPRSIRERVIVKRHILFQKNYYVINKLKKETYNYPQDGILGALSRYFNILTMGFDRGDKENFSILQRGKSKIKDLYIRAKSDSPQESTNSWETKTLKDEQKSSNYSEKNLTVQKPYKTITQLYNESVQKNQHKEFRKQVEKKEAEKSDEVEEVFDVPPPARCKLCCPLPPPEFRAEEPQEYRANYQSPFVKFANQPEVFLPPYNKPLPFQQQFASHLSLTAKSLPKLSPSKELMDLMTYKKIYPSDLKVCKPQAYVPRPTDPPKMKALLYEHDSSSFNYKQVNIPTHIYKDEVLVQVVYSGVRDTDLQVPEKKSSPKTPLILGQEITGRVYAAGREVHHVKEDDNVAINPYTACLSCRYCRRGLYSSCLKEGSHNSIGIGKNGGWAEFVVVKKSQIYKIPDDLSLDRAVFIQPLSQILSALSKLNLSHSMDILIQGIGLSGFLWATALHFKGYRNVFVSDENEKRLNRFKNLNLNYPFVPFDEVENYSADVIIECSGSGSSIEKCIKTVNPNGQICFFGKPNRTSEVRFTPYDLVKKEITILGNTGNTGNIFSFSSAVDLAATMGQKYLNFNKLGVKIFKLKDFEQAFHMKKTGEVGKVIFKLDN